MASKDKFNYDDEAAFDNMDIDAMDAEIPEGHISKAKKITSTLFKSIGTGSAKGIRNAVRSRLTESDSDINDLSQAITDGKAAVDEIAEGLQPVTNSIKKVTLGFMPMVKKLLPKGLYDKAYNKLKESTPEEEETPEQREARARQEQTNEALKAIFESQKAGTEADMAFKAASTMRENKRFKHQQLADNALLNGIKQMVLHMRGPATGYMRKSLELQYQQLFVSKDVFRATAQIGSILNAKLEEIKHNTSLPDSVKADALKKKGILPAIGRLASKSLGGLLSTMVDTGKKKIKDAISEAMGALTNLEMGAESAGAMGPISKLSAFSSILGYGANWLAGRKAGKYLDEARDTVSEADKKLTGGFGWLKRQILTKAKEGREGKGGIFGALANFFVPEEYKQTSITDKAIEDPTAAIAFDVSSKTALTKIIPKHLERIGDFVEAAYGTQQKWAELWRKTAADQETDTLTTEVSHKEYNVFSDKLSSRKEVLSSIRNRAYANDVDIAKNMSTAMARTKNYALNGPGERIALKKDDYTGDKFEVQYAQFLKNLATSQNSLEMDEIVDLQNKFRAGKGITWNPSAWEKAAFKDINEGYEQRIVNYVYAATHYKDGSEDSYATTQLCNDIDRLVAQLNPMNALDLAMKYNISIDGMKEGERTSSGNIKINSDVGANVSFFKDDARAELTEVTERSKRYQKIREDAFKKIDEAPLNDQEKDRLRGVIKDELSAKAVIHSVNNSGTGIAIDLAHKTRNIFDKVTNAGKKMANRVDTLTSTVRDKIKPKDKHGFIVLQRVERNIVSDDDNNVATLCVGLFEETDTSVLTAKKGQNSAARDRFIAAGYKNPEGETEESFPCRVVDANCKIEIHDKGPVSSITDLPTWADVRAAWKAAMRGAYILFKDCLTKELWEELCEKQNNMCLISSNAAVQVVANFEERPVGKVISSKDKPLYQRKVNVDATKSTATEPVLNREKYLDTIHEALNARDKYETEHSYQLELDPALKTKDDIANHLRKLEKENKSGNITYSLTENGKGIIKHEKANEGEYFHIQDPLSKLGNSLINAKGDEDRRTIITNAGYKDDEAQKLLDEYAKIEKTARQGALITDPEEINQYNKSIEEASKRNSGIGSRCKSYITSIAIKQGYKDKDIDTMIDSFVNDRVGAYYKLYRLIGTHLHKLFNDLYSADGLCKIIEKNFNLPYGRNRNFAEKLPKEVSKKYLDLLAKYEHAKILYTSALEEAESFCNEFYKGTNSDKNGKSLFSNVHQFAERNADASFRKIRENATKDYDKGAVTPRSGELSFNMRKTRSLQKKVEAGEAGHAEEMANREAYGEQYDEMLKGVQETIENTPIGKRDKALEKFDKRMANLAKRTKEKNDKETTDSKNSVSSDATHFSSKSGEKRRPFKHMAVWRSNNQRVQPVESATINSNDAVVNSINENSEKIIDVIREVHKGFLAGFGRSLKSLFSFSHKTTEEQPDSISQEKDTPKFKEKLKEKAKGALATAKASIIKVLTSAKNASIKVFVATKNTVIKASSAIKTHVITACGTVKNGAIKAFNVMKSAVVKMANVTTEYIKNAWSVIQEKTPELWNKTKKWTTEKGRKVKDYTKEKYHKTKDFIKEKYGKTKSWIQEEYKKGKLYLFGDDEHEGAVDKAKKKLSEYYEDAKSKATEMWDDVKNKFSMSSVGQTIRGFTNKFYTKDYVDIYLKDKVEPGNPLLSQRKQRDGVFFQDGKKVEHSYDIKEPVFDAEKNTLITKEDITTGLVDVDNKPINPGVINKIIDSVKGGKLGDIISTIAEKTKSVWGWIKDKFHGKKGGPSLLKRLFGSVGATSKWQKKVLARLDTIIEIMNPTARQGSLEDQKADKEKADAERAERLAKNMQPGKDKVVAASSSSSAQRNGGLFSKLNDKLTKWIAPLISKAKGWILLGIGFIKKSIINASKAVFKKLSTWGKELFSKLGNWGSQAFKTLVPKVSGFAKGFMSKATGLAKNLVSKATGLSKNLVSKATGLSKNLVSKATGLAKNLVSKATGLAKNLVPKATGLAKNLVPKVTGLAKNLVPKATGLAKGLVTKATPLLSKAAPLLGKAAPLLAKAAAAAGPIGLAALAGTVGIVKGIKGWKNAGKNWGLKEGQKATATQKTSSAIASALTLGFGGKRATKAVNSVMNFTGINNFIKAIGGNRAVMDSKDIEKFQKKCLAKIKLGHSQYKQLLSSFNNAVASEDWVQARAISGNEVSVLKELGKGLIKINPVYWATRAGLGITKALFRNRNKDAMTQKEIDSFIKKMNSKISKGDRSAPNLLNRFQEAVADENWPLARALSGKKVDRLIVKLGKKVGRVIATKGFGPLAWIADAVIGKDRDKTPMSKKEIEAAQKRLGNWAKTSAKGRKALSLFNEACEEQDWKTARSISGNKLDSAIKRNIKTVKSTHKWIRRIGTLGLSMLFEKGTKDDPLTEKEIQTFVNRQQTKIKKGNKKAEVLLDKFNEAIAQQNWKKARAISGIKVKDSVAVKGAKRLFGFFWGHQETPLKQQEIDKFRESMNRKMKIGGSQGKIAERKLEAFEDAIAVENWKKARAISKMKHQGIFEKTNKAIARKIDYMFIGSRNAPMSEKEIKEARVHMQDNITKGVKNAQKMLDMFEDAIADENWLKARSLAKMKSTSAVGRAVQATADWFTGASDQMSDVEIEKVTSDLQKQIKAGGPNGEIAKKKLEMFERAVEAGLWKRARAIVGAKGDSVFGKVTRKMGRAARKGGTGLAILTLGVSKLVAKMFTKKKGEHDIHDCEDIRKELEEKVENDEDNVMIWERILSRFDIFVKDGSYTAAYNYAEEAIAAGTKELKQMSREVSGTQSASEELRLATRAKNIEANIRKSREKTSRWRHPIKYNRLGKLITKCQDMSMWSDEYFDELEIELTDIDEEAETTYDNVYKEDPKQKKLTEYAKLLKLTLSKFKMEWLRDNPSAVKQISDLLLRLDVPPTEYTEEMLNSIMKEYKQIKADCEGDKKLNKDIKKTQNEVAKDIEAETKTAGPKQEKAPGSEGYVTVNMNGQVIKIDRATGKRVENQVFYSRAGEIRRACRFHDAVGEGLSPMEMANAIKDHKYESAVAYDSTGRIVNAARGGVDGVDIQGVKGGTIVHNHPDGSPITATDKRAARLQGLKAVTVASPNGINTTTFNSKEGELSPKVRKTIVDIVKSGVAKTAAMPGSVISKATSFVKRAATKLNPITKIKEAVKPTITKYKLRKRVDKGDMLALNEKLDTMISLLQTMISTTANAGNGIIQRVDNAENNAIAKSAAYSNTIMEGLRPKPNEPPLKPVEINFKKQTSNQPKMFA